MKNLGIRVSLRAADEAQKDRWEKAAADAGLGLAEWIRRTLDKASGGPNLHESAIVARMNDLRKWSRDDWFTPRAYAKHRGITYGTSLIWLEQQVRRGILERDASRMTQAWYRFHQ